MAIEFRILGEVDALVGGDRLEIGHARQRSVLACLLIDANRPVSTDQLGHRLWGDEPPRRVRNVLAAYVSRLRQLLAGHDDVYIVRGPGGYMLRVDPLSVDVHLFHHLVAAAREAGTPAEAAELYGAALALWRGEPFALLDTPWAGGARQALHAEKFAVELERNDAALDAGRHAELLAALVAASHQHPFDERLAGQLMLAQYRSARQADALGTFRQMRNRLVDELGVEPGGALRRLHQQILDNDAALAVAADGVGGGEQEPAPPAPEMLSPKSPVRAAHHGLPRRATSLIGREREIADVATALQDGSLITLTGVGGVGKTRLALEVAERNEKRFDDGAFFCELAPIGEGAAVGQAVTAALRLPGTPGPGVSSAVVDYLASRQSLLVIDNCEHVLDAAAALVDDITRRCPRVAVLATSREALGVEGERVVPVPPLPETDAAALFADRAKAGKPDFDLDLEPVGAIAEICRRLDGIPLAIELAAARTRAMSSLDIARRLDRLRLLSGGTRGAHPRQQSVAATIDWSYQLLSDAERALFARLSVFSGTFDLEAVHAICADDGATEDDTLELLTGLVDKSMVTVRGGHTSRYGVLEMLRTYGRNRLQEDALHDEFATRHARYYTELVERTAAGLRGPDEQAWAERMAPDAFMTLTSPEFDNLRAAFERAMAVGDGDLALRLVTSLPELIVRIGYHSADWVQRAVEIADPGHPLYVAGVGMAARIAWVFGDLARARSIVRLVAGRDPAPGASYSLFPGDVLADVALYEGDAAATLAHYSAELRRARDDMADPIRVVWILYNITICHDVLGTPSAALPAGQWSIVVAENTGNPSTRAMACCALGRALKDSEPLRALAMFDEAAALAASVQNNWLRGMAWMETGGIHAESGDPATVARQLIEVLGHWRQGGGPGTVFLQWQALRYVTRLLTRVGADEDAAVLRRALADAGRQAADVSDPSFAESSRLDQAQATALAESALWRIADEVG